jgi:pyruvate dehydrogenase E2 component (dihydrolipoamide acetyltransferase)
MKHFLMPTLGADMEAGTLVAWRKQPGERVHRGETLAEVDTDKGVIDVEVFHDGVIDSLLVGPGAKVPVGTPLATIREAGEQAVEKQPAEAAGVQAKGVRAATELPAAAEPAAGQPDRQARMRRAIAAAMSRSKREIPHFYLATTIDAAAAVAFVAAQNDTLPADERLLLGAVFVKAAACAVREVPEVNGYWRDDAVELLPTVNVGLAVSLRGGGLVILTLRDPASSTLTALSQQIRELTQRARTGRLKASELADATLTVTSLGDRGVDSVWGVIYPPQLAIVGFGTVARRPLVVADRVEARSAVTVTLAADHRALDGHRAGLYLTAIAEQLQQPETL